MLKKVIDYLMSRQVSGFDNDVLAHSAQGILSNVAYDSAREAILKRIFVEWVASNPDQVSKREQLYFEMCALGKIQAELNLLVLNQTKDNGYDQS